LDFWSFGVIAFQFLCNRKPFEGNSVSEVFEKIVKRKLEFPEVGVGEGKITQEGKDFLDRLLTIDPNKRLGSNGIDEIKQHPFFKEIDWENILEQEAPFAIGGAEADTSQFPKANLNEEANQHLYNDIKMTSSSIENDHPAFNDFDAVNYPTLQNLNHKAAQKKLLYVKLKKQKESPSAKIMQRIL